MGVMTDVIDTVRVSAGLPHLIDLGVRSDIDAEAIFQEAITPPWSIQHKDLMSPGGLIVIIVKLSLVGDISGKRKAFVPLSVEDPQ